MAREHKRARKPHELHSEAKSPATSRAFRAFLRLLPLDSHDAATALGMELDTLSEYDSGKKSLPLADYRRLFKSIGAEATGEWLLALVAYVDDEDDTLTQDVINATSAEVQREAKQLAASLRILGKPGNRLSAAGK